MSQPKRKIELLAPAKDFQTAVDAIDCGADAVYIGGAKFGARYAAGNSLDDIRSTVEYAHRYGAKVYATLNTLLFDNELEEAHKQALALIEAGVDALIVQDMAYTRLGLEGVELNRKLFEKRPEFKGVRNYISAAGIGKLIEMIYREELVSPEASREMLDMMHAQQCTNKIPLFLPRKISAAHKTGEDDHLSNDVGIVYAPQPFIICFAGHDTDVYRWDKKYCGIQPQSDQR